MRREIGLYFNNKNNIIDAMIDCLDRISAVQFFDDHRTIQGVRSCNMANIESTTDCRSIIYCRR